MQEAQPRAALRAPTFIRLLAGLGEADVAAPGPLLAERLGQWIDWTHAVALSRALDGAPPPPDGADATVDEAACQRARSALLDAIGRHRDWAAAVPPGTGFDAFRERYLTLQRTMLAATGKLRGELRDALAGRSPALARLAEVDALMERVLSPREYALLATVPDLLGRHFARLQQAAAPATDPAPDPAPPASAPWLETFRRDMHSVLLAELDVRFQPVEALHAALRTP